MQALCIHTQAAPTMVKLAIQTGERHMPIIELEELNKLNTFLVDRAICDTKAEDAASVMAAESTLQLLPYMVLRAPGGKYYMYSRGKGGAEDRLKKNTSVGAGGHVDRAPRAMHSLYSLLQEEAAREIKEEVGIDVDPLAINFTHYIVDRTNAVGRVHLGLFAVVDVPDEAVKSNEPDMLTDDGFFHLQELSGPGYEKLENWSKMCVELMVGDGGTEELDSIELDEDELVDAESEDDLPEAEDRDVEVADDELTRKAYNEEQSAKESMAAEPEAADSTEDDGGADDSNYSLAP